MALDDHFDLTDVNDLARVLYAARHTGTVTVDGLYCVRCGAQRRMRVYRRYWDGLFAGEAAALDAPRGTPVLLSAICVQCDLIHDVLIHEGPSGPEVAIFSPERGGFSTPNTPDNVKYYLDQAHRAESVGATSAAVTMYRSAVEMLLYEQGYTSGMLAAKIQALLDATSPPPWRDQIDPDYLEVMKQLGNAATHPNDGDVQRQNVLDRELLVHVRAVFEELLDLVYERPAIAAARKANLQAAAASFKTP